MVIIFENQKYVNLVMFNKNTVVMLVHGNITNYCCSKS